MSGLYSYCTSIHTTPKHRRSPPTMGNRPHHQGQVDVNICSIFFFFFTNLLGSGPKFSMIWHDSSLTQSWPKCHEEVGTQWKGVSSVDEKLFCHSESLGWLALDDAIFACLALILSVIVHSEKSCDYKLKYKKYLMKCEWRLKFQGLIKCITCPSGGNTSWTSAGQRAAPLLHRWQEPLHILWAQDPVQSSRWAEHCLLRHDNVIFME